MATSRSIPSRLRMSGFLTLAVLATACVRGPGEAEPPGSGPGGEYGSVVLSLTTVPADVQCVRVTVAGSTTVVRTFMVTSGGSATLPVAGLPLGNATVYEEAFDMVCSLIGPASLPTWVAAAPVPVVLTPTAATPVTIVLRRPGGLQIGMDFQENATLSFNPASRDFGPVAVGSSATATFVVTNTGNTATSVLTTMVTGPNAAQFQISGNTCAASVPAIGTCSVTITFAPGIPGPLSALVTVSGGAASGSAMVFGTGVTNPGLTISPATGDFGNVTSGSSSTRTFTVTNTGGSATTPLGTMLTGADAGNFTFTMNSCAGSLLAPNASCTIALSFIAGSLGMKTATLTVSAALGGPSVQAALTANSVASQGLQLSPATADFGNVVVGQTSSRALTLTNTGPPSGPLGVALAGADVSAFTFFSNGCSGQSLGTNMSCTVVVTFAPGSVGAKMATLTASSASAAPVSAALVGTGTAAGSMTISPATQSFGNVALGQSVTQSFDVLNGGTNSGPVAVSIVGVDATQFSLLMNGCTGSLTPGQICSMTVRFAPGSVGNKSATLTVASTNNGTVTSALSGTGVMGGGGLTISPSSFDFGNVPVGGSQPATFTVVNGGVTATPPLQVTLGSGAFIFQANSCAGLALAPNTSCTVQVQFVAQLGPVMAQLTVLAGAASASASLAGKGVSAVLTPAPTSLSFTGVPVGSQSGFKTVTVTNTGNIASKALIMSLGGADAAHFQLGSGTCQGQAVPAQGSCTAIVRAVPTTVGNKSASLSLAEVGGGVTTTIPLSATVINWTHLDVGTVGATGSWSQSSLLHTIQGAGNDIWNMADAFHFTFVPMSGNTTITARVVSIQFVDEWSKAVVMMRDGTAPNAANVVAHLPALASHQYRQQSRLTAGAVTTSFGDGSGQPGVWLRVSRVNNTFTTSFSTDGNTFAPLGMPVNVTMSQSISVGIGVTSHKAGSLATGTFDNVSITQP